MSAKCLKHLSNFSESEILAGVLKLSKDEQDLVDKISKKLVKKLDTVDTTKIKKMPKKKTQASPREIFIEALVRIQYALSEYERSEAVDEWTIDFEIVVDYQVISKDDVVRLHNKLITSELNTMKTTLLIKVERGKMYDSLKFSEKWNKSWSELCEALNICPRTAMRYIDFYRIINAYPRLLICSLSFETIMKCYKQLKTYLLRKENQQLSLRLQEPLRKISLADSKTISPENLPKEGDPPTEQLSAGATWDAGWELSDNILSRTEEDDHSYDDEEDGEEDEMETLTNGVDLCEIKTPVYHRKR